MPKIQNLLIPGGLGFVGSNTIVELFSSTGANLIVVDDFSNCYDDVIDRVVKILSQKFNPQDINKRIKVVKGNVLDLDCLDKIFKEQVDKNQPIDGIMHFAAKKAVNQSIFKPLEYYENNLVGSMNLFKMMEKYEQCVHFIFSSTAAVYGDRDGCKESDVKDPNNPYAQSKSCVEMLMKSLAIPHKNWKLISLRYFNPVGAHQTGLIGDDPSAFPTNLIPVVQEVIIGKRPILQIFGSDYPTPDGSGVRDFIHITDLAKAHVKAFERLEAFQPGLQIFNLGTGKGHSVLEVVAGFQKALGEKINYVMADRRAGDLPQLVANVEKANKILGWRAQKTIYEVAKDCVKFIEVRHGYKPGQKDK